MERPAGKQTSDIVDWFLACLAGGDLVAASKLFAERITFMIPSAPDVAWIPAVRTRQDMLGFLQGLDKYLVPRTFKVEHKIVNGTEAVLIGELQDLVKSTGKTFVSPFALHMSVEHGLITRYCLYEDSYAVAQAIA